MSTKRYSPKKFDELFATTMDELKKLAQVKGGEYSGDADRLANFRRVAANAGITKETALFTYMSKHWDAISTYVRDNQLGVKRVRSEKMAGRVHDLMVYSLLLLAMLEEGTDGDE